MSEYIVEIPFNNFKQATIFHNSVDGSRLKTRQPLNSNQQIVLEWLKDNVLQDGTSAMCSVFQFGTLWELRRFNDKEAIRVDNAYCELNNNEQFQLLAAFAEWGMKEVAE